MSVNPEWERWHKSLRHDEVKSIGDAVEQLMYEVIEFGGDMGPNGNVWNGVDEGDVLTAGYINEWVERFENMLGRGTCEVIGFDDGYDEGLDGEWFALAPATWFLSCDHEAHGRRPSYCPVCGRKVKEG